jgi:hypothetical protein
MSMTKAKFLVLIVIGAVIGFGAFYIKKDADRASQIVENRDKSAFETCKFNNEIVAKFDPKTEQRNCEKEYLE